MPRIRRVLETPVYVRDLDRAIAFYRDVLGLEVMTGSERFAALDAGGGSVLLLFIHTIHLPERGRREMVPEKRPTRMRTAVMPKENTKR